MKKILFGLAAAGLLFAAPAPVSAQDAAVKIRTGDGPGVAVRIGDRDRYRHRDQVRVIHRDRYVQRSYASCRTVIVKERLPDGTRVIKRMRRC